MTSSLTDLAIVPVDYRSLSEEQIVALNAFENAMGAESDPDDPPTPLEVTRATATNHPDVVVINEFWALETDGSIAGLGFSWWKQTPENRHVAHSRMEILPTHRRRGLAKALLPRVLDAVEADGRSLIITWTSDRAPAGEAFARRVGAEPASAVHANRLLLADVDRDVVRRWVEEGPVRAPDYELLMLDDVYPDDLIEEIVRLQDVMNTAPRDDLDMEDEEHTVEEMRQREQQGVAAGTTRWSLFAKHVPTGELVGLSVVYWNPAQPDTVFQGDTGVQPEHRGHALGKWLKAAMIERIFRDLPDAVDIRTGNADSNDAMLGINHALGFKPYVAQMNWQVPVERVRAYLAGSSS
jgi:GNAT superfamily N-acetyltransferase